MYLPDPSSRLELCLTIQTGYAKTKVCHQCGAKNVKYTCGIKVHMNIYPSLILQTLQFVDGLYPFILIHMQIINILQEVTIELSLI